MECFDNGNSRATRAQAELCFLEMCRTLVMFGMDDEYALLCWTVKTESLRLPQPSSLKAALDVLHRTTSPLAQEGSKIHEVPLPKARSMLIAKRIVADNQLLMFKDEQLHRFVEDACAAARDHRHAVRLPALEVIRVLRDRLPDKKLVEYKVRCTKKTIL